MSSFSVISTLCPPPLIIFACLAHKSRDISMVTIPYGLYVTNFKLRRYVIDLKSIADVSYTYVG